MATFEICFVCQKHGRIMTNAWPSGEVCAKDDAGMTVVLLVAQGFFSKEEVDQLGLQIRNSPLPALNKDVDEATRKIIIDWNIARFVALRQGSDSEFHDPSKIHPV